MLANPSPRLVLFTVLIPLLGGAASAQSPRCGALELFAPDAEAQDIAGDSVDVDGDTLVVGAPGDDDAGAESGAAYVWIRSGAGWTMQQKLVPSDAGPNTQFGFPVELHGEVLAVGAEAVGTAHPTGNGAVYLYRRSGTTWNEIAKLTANDGALNDRFGVSIDFDADTLVVGAHLIRVGNATRGAVYVFERTSSGWSRQAKLGPSGSWHQGLGRHVHVEGDTLVATAPYANSYDGRVYVFERSGTTWTETQRIDRPPGTGYSVFGWDVDLDGDALLIGAVGHIGAFCPNPCPLGDAFLYRRQGAAWALESVFAPADLRFESLFGTAVELEGDVAVFGVSGDNALAQWSGAAYVFRRTGTTWRQVAKLIPEDLVMWNVFGSSLAVDGSTLVVGARQDYDAAPVAGSAYVYSLDELPVSNYCAGKTSSLGCVPFLTTAGAASVSGPWPFRVRAGNLVPYRRGTLLYSLRRANLDHHGGKLCVRAPYTRLPVQKAAATGSGPCSGILRRDLGPLLRSGSDPALTAGRVVYAQWVQEDPQDPTGFGDTMTDAVRFTVWP